MQTVNILFSRMQKKEKKNLKKSFSSALQQLCTYAHKQTHIPSSYIMFPLSKDLVNKSITLVTDLVSQPRLADVTQWALGFLLYNAFSLFTSTVELSSQKLGISDILMYQFDMTA